MQTIVLPISVCKEMEKICRDFLWHGRSEARKFHLVNWDTVIKFKKLVNVRSFWINGEWWNWMELRRYLPNYVLKFLLSVVLSDIVSDWDSMSGARHLQLIWKVRGTECMRVFLWGVAHGKVMSNVERKMRTFTNIDTCGLCLLSAETTFHTLRDCFFAKQVWDKFEVSRLNEDFYRVDNVVDWLTSNLQIFDGKFNGVAWDILFIISCFGVCGLLEAELWSILSALRIVWDRGWRKVLIQTDCSVAMDIISGRGEAAFRVTNNLVKNIIELLKREWDIEVVKVFQEANRVADSLATRVEQYSVQIDKIDRTELI
uniref:Uncharacterized protein n=1 Tax=Manihot esculenta TaxID=3983 RepID=A0A2C9UXN9_MANES